MKKNLLDYMNGDTNVVRDEFVIGRERSGKAELITVSVPDTEKPLYALWHSYKKVNGNKGDKVEGNKGTGGKKAYVKVILRECVGLKDAPLDVKGAVFSLFDFIEWDTGRLWVKRTKKSLTVSDMGGVFNAGAEKTRRILNSLIRLGVLRYEIKPMRGYFMNASMISKGVSKIADTV